MLGESSLMQRSGSSPMQTVELHELEHRLLSVACTIDCEPMQDSGSTEWMYEVRDCLPDTLKESGWSYPSSLHEPMSFAG
jgi:hypothetical protein